MNMTIEQRLQQIEQQLKEINHRFKLSELIDDIGFTMTDADIACDINEDTATAISILTKLQADIAEKLTELRGNAGGINE